MYIALLLLLLTIPLVLLTVLGKGITSPNWRQNIITLLLALTTIATTVCWLHSRYKQDKKIYLQQKTDELQTTYHVILASFARASRLAFHEAISHPATLKFFRAAQSEDKATINRMRTDTFNQLLPLYKRLQQQDFRQFHFHLPDCTSLLRFHRPARFSDNLTSVRSSVVLANKEKREVNGFEEGRIFNGFRYVYPVMDGNEHLGSMEISVSFDAIQKEMDCLFEQKHHMILRADVVENKVFESEQHQYRPAELDPRFVSETATLACELCTRIQQDLPEKSTAALHQMKSFAMQNTMGETPYLSVFMPVLNVAGNAVSYLISHDQNDHLNDLRTIFFTQSTITTIGILLIAGLLRIVALRNRDLRIARNIAEHASHAKSAFLSNMSHEIRTPMNAVIGMTDLLMETELNPEQRESANIIRVSGEALLTLINDVLDFSKIEAGHMELEEQDFDLSHCVEGSLDLMVSKAAEKDIELIYEIDGNVPSVIRGDAGRLRQILLNLLSNAVKFTHEGEICVSVTAKPLDEETEIELAVRDTGIGIDPDKLEKIFAEFSQADVSTTRQYGGTGLGLTISRKLSELMGGRLWAESVPGEGTTFRFTLHTPVTKQIRTIRANQQAFDISNRDVLIVDDNETNLKILSAQLTRWGVTPVAFNTPHAALEAIENGGEYAFMISDMQMPKMDGTILIGEVRKHRTAAELPIIVLTSLGLEKPDKALDISAYLTKPVKPAQLYQNIANILHGEGGNYTEVVATTRAQESAAPLKILLAEDNLLNQKVAMKMLDKLGYAADLAKDGIEALEMAEENEYDLILMDIEMPRMDGLTATKELIKHFGDGTRPLIIGMTAHAANEGRERGLAAGMDDYLTKPIQLVKLKEVLWKLQEKETT